MSWEWFENQPNLQRDFTNHFFGAVEPDFDVTVLRFDHSVVVSDGNQTQVFHAMRQSPFISVARESVPSLFRLAAQHHVLEDNSIYLVAIVRRRVNIQFVVSF